MGRAGRPRDRRGAARRCSSGTSPTSPGGRVRRHRGRPLRRGARASSRLPTAEDTDVWHNPPLWFALAGAIYRAGEIVGIGDPGPPRPAAERAASSSGSAVLTALLARELFPERRALPLVALGCVVLTPDPRPCGRALPSRAARRAASPPPRSSRSSGRCGGTLSLATGAGIGLLVGLANLTRTWALARSSRSCSGRSGSRSRANARRTSVRGGGRRRRGLARRALARGQDGGARQPTRLQPAGSLASGASAAARRRSGSGSISAR